jgi:hypothetical protein
MLGEAYLSGKHVVASASSCGWSSVVKLKASEISVISPLASLAGIVPRVSERRRPCPQPQANSTGRKRGDQAPSGAVHGTEESEPLCSAPGLADVSEALSGGLSHCASITPLMVARRG